MRRPRAAFTLIELAVVMVVMSLLATMTVVTFGGTMDRYRLAKAMEAVERFDAYIRREARATQQNRLAAIDRRKGRLGLVVNDQRKSRTFQIPSQVEITDLTIVDPSGQRRVGGTVANFAVSSSGRTQTYAMRLQRGKYDRWLVVLGFSGQIVALDNRGAVDALLGI